MASRRRMAPEVYWQLRCAAEDCRRWLTSYCAGSKAGMEWFDLWGVAESVGITLAGVYQSGGYPAVCHALMTDDRLECWLSRLAAAVTLQQAGDPVMAADLLAGRPPGAAPLAPEWALQSARESARTTALQRARLRSGKAAGESAMGGEGDDSALGAPRRPRRRGGSSSGTAAAAGGKSAGTSAGAPSKGGGAPSRS